MSPHLPRVVLYHQTHHFPNTTSEVPLSPLVHSLPSDLHPHVVVILAAVHLNTSPTPHLTLNDDLPAHPKFSSLFACLEELRENGITVTCMLGGAAQGSFRVLDVTNPEWEVYYQLLAQFLRDYAMSGIDLDVEEEMSLAGIVRIIRRLRADFGPEFIITLAPVATALQPGFRHLSGFSYFALEQEVGSEVAWYNTQFYCGWGDLRDPAAWARILGAGWDPRKVVVGTVTNPANAGGYVETAAVAEMLGRLKSLGVGGVAGWEFWNALPGGEEDAWMWCLEMAAGLGLLE
ncbi:glycoside hydrolase superfamily [Sphaerosporella brunnea]|uniref:Glycoside hydrolase superfamily n=1 Tax=Sphaerosporella brunnea TaxID=1250544 RepID=A0A5J5EDU5_9PEZI|nr:glycoside hydrolase superfamily [Sphaerosporella brunnea]